MAHPHPWATSQRLNRFIENMSKTYLELSEAQREKRATLTPKERNAVDTFIAAARSLPPSICIHVDDNDWGEPNLVVSKRITSGSARQVATLRKKSLCF
jgi:hypothetical protein